MCAFHVSLLGMLAPASHEVCRLARGWSKGVDRKEEGLVGCADLSICDRTFGRGGLRSAELIVTGCLTVRATQGKGVMPDGTTRFSYNGQPILHYMGCSTFSECTVMAEVSLAKINPAANPEQVCLLGCGVTTGLGAVKNTANVQPGDTVAVFGFGGI